MVDPEVGMCKCTYAYVLYMCIYACAFCVCVCWTECCRGQRLLHPDPLPLLFLSSPRQRQGAMAGRSKSRAHPGGLCDRVQSPSSCKKALRSDRFTLCRHEVVKAFLNSQAHYTHCGTCSPNYRCCLECQPRSPLGKVDPVMPGHGGEVLVGTSPSCRWQGLLGFAGCISYRRWPMALRKKHSVRTDGQQGMGMDWFSQPHLIAHDSHCLS